MQQCQKEPMKTTYCRYRNVFIVAKVEWHGENQENDAKQSLDCTQMKQKYVAGRNLWTNRRKSESIEVNSTVEHRPVYGQTAQSRFR